MTEYNAALCGLGNIAWRFDWQKRNTGLRLSHASVYQNHSKTRLIAGFSPDQTDSYAFQNATGLPVYQSLPEMLADKNPDIVSICSPSCFHYEQVNICLEHGVPMIWLEKPPALALHEVDMLLARLASGKSTVQVNYQRRYLPAYQELRRYFLSNTLGACRQIQASYSRGLETNGSHILDMLFFISGDSADYHLEWVSISGGDDNPSFALTLGDGTSVIVIGAPLPYHNIDISLTCDGGRIAVLYGGMECRVEAAGEHKLFPGFYRLYPQERDGVKGMAGLTGGMENALEDLLDAHEQRRLPVSNLHTARKTTALIQEVQEWQRLRR